jgi:uncharacterized protein (TIGR03435 family)
MIRIVALLLLAFLQARPEFEVASIRPAAEQTQGVAVGLHIDGSQVSFNYLSIKEYVVLAYRVKPNQVIGPDWMATQRFNIAAKLPDGTATDQVLPMLQSLLADRFQMKMHREMREFPIYTVGVAKTGLKMTAIPPDPNLDETAGAPLNIGGGGDARGVTISLPRGASFSLGATAFEAKRLDMPTFADMLTRFSDRSVMDMTGLKGRYDFTLELSPEDRTANLIRSAVSAGLTLPPQTLRALDYSSNASLIDSLQRLGLTFEARKGPLEVLVVDSVQKTPTEN